MAIQLETAAIARDAVNIDTVLLLREGKQNRQLASLDDPHARGLLFEYYSFNKPIPMSFAACMYDLSPECSEVK